MKSLTRIAILPHSPEAMFDLVKDVASYSSFLPWCAASEVLQESEEEALAKLTIQAPLVRQAFTTRLQFTRPHQIDLSLVEGPFKMLKGKWQFTPLGADGCRTQLDLQFKADGMLARALEATLESAADRLVEAFCAQAEKELPSTT